MNTQRFKPMKGFLLIDSLFQLKNIKQLPSFLLGDFDEVIKSAFFFKEHKREATSIEELEACRLSQIALDTLKTMVRNSLQASFDNLAEKELQRQKDNKQQLKREAAQNFKSQHQSSDIGTVSEIADKYSLSKKKVRELKRNGELESYIENL